MRKRSKLVSMLLVVLLLSSLLLAGACGPAGEEGVTEIEILAVESGLAGYFLSFGLGDIINNYSTSRTNFASYLFGKLYIWFCPSCNDY